jgi:quinol monooxygenase YgiN
MSFQQEHVDTFLEIFESSKHKIRNFDGCLHLELLNDTAAPNRFFTFSKWESEDHLNKYRQSELFLTTWAATKILFNEKPEAWSSITTSRT